MELSKVEIELLSQIYPDPPRIKEGRLLGYQREALNQLRTGVHYLEGKYPGYDFTYLSFNPSSRSSSNAMLMFSEGDATYEVVVDCSRKELVCSDTFYGRVVQEEYSKALESLLKPVLGVVKSFTDFPVPVGKEIGLHTSVKELNEVKPWLARNTHLFVNKVSCNEDKQKECMGLLTGKGFYGSYLMFGVDEDKVRRLGIGQLEEIRDELDAVSFNCFG